MQAKKWITLAIAAAMAVSLLAACGGPGSSAGVALNASKIEALLEAREVDAAVTADGQKAFGLVYTLYEENADGGVTCGFLELVDETAHPVITQEAIEQGVAAAVSSDDSCRACMFLGSGILAVRIPASVGPSVSGERSSVRVVPSYQESQSVQPVMEGHFLDAVQRAETESGGSVDEERVGQVPRFVVPSSPAASRGRGQIQLQVGHVPARKRVAQGQDAFPERVAFHVQCFLHPEVEQGRPHVFSGHVIVLGAGFFQGFQPGFCCRVPAGKAGIGMACGGRGVKREPK